ncbi:MAG: antibiotic biosynthesis monooxygenase [Actinomycetota bacterium]
MSGGDRADDRGVTLVIRRRVRPERRVAYEQRLGELLDDAPSIAGYLGADVQRPGPDDDRYVSIVRFASPSDLDAFRRSAINESFQLDVAAIADGAAVWDEHTGLEFWFDPPSGTVVAQPVRWRMAMVLGVVVYVLVLVFGAIAAAVIGSWPGPLRLAAVIAVEIVLMTYVLLPRITRALAGWIYPSADRV